MSSQIHPCQSTTILYFPALFVVGKRMVAFRFLHTGGKPSGVLFFLGAKNWSMLMKSMALIGSGKNQ